MNLATYADECGRTRADGSPIIVVMPFNNETSKTVMKTIPVTKKIHFHYHPFQTILNRRNARTLDINPKELPNTLLRNPLIIVSSSITQNILNSPSPSTHHVHNHTTLTPQPALNPLSPLLLLCPLPPNKLGPNIKLLP